MFLIKEMNVNDRPREKLLNEGVEYLTNTELLAILLRSGYKNKSVMSLSKEVLELIEHIYELRNVKVTDLLKIPGIKEAKATSIIAAIELGKRLERLEFKNKKLTSSHDIYHYMKHLKHEERENLCCIFLNTKLAVIKEELIYKGTVNEVMIHPREIFKRAIELNSTYIVLVHNHPSGDAKPSSNDNIATKKLIEAGKIMNITVLDHIIIGNEQFYSYEQKQVFYV